MALDTLCMQAISNELNSTILGARIEKVYQPEKDEITLNLRTYTDSYRLTLSASPQNPRIHFTNLSKSNPQTPPMFCMLMRKHTTSGKITKIESLPDDRILIIDIESYNELGDLTVKHLIVEIMGRHSNIILANADMTIIDSVKHIDYTVSSVRQILPGMIYSFPPKQEKHPILCGNFSDMVFPLPEHPIRAEKYILNTIGGISPLTAKEIAYRAFGSCDTLIPSEGFADKLAATLKGLIEAGFSPCLITERESGRILDYSAIDITLYESLAEIKKYESISELLEDFYKTKDSAERMKQKSADIIKLLNTNIAKISKKLNILKATLYDAKNKDKHKKYGDLLMANLHALKPGDTTAIVCDYFSENLEEISIPLLPELSPAANAQRYYKLYNKAKTAETEAAIQLKKATNELEYLESTLALAENCLSETDINAIRAELAELGYLKIRTKGRKQAPNTSKPHHFISSDGFDIYVGKNNTQNDKLTLRFANSGDIWFHTKKIHGSHVIIKLGIDKEVPMQTMREAAELAAYFSKARESSQVPVDYTTVKNVKKPVGAKPGMVIYDSYNTVYVTPKQPLKEEV